ncbi:HAD family hydrolase [Cellulomonas edaphi]|uniref:HAD family phosphatase n=1 Tax=Cellulomonas edaphi TaxID=3053468 RepID=A0ABT7S5W8_9CELL|nr:HAD family phosphatase [Cellulomons edaphi]MDM7831016.1 HAD family phosphatase [Cellulomons edaphi]
MLPSTPALPAAVLWDMDGTLINTEPLWIAAETELVASHGGVWTHEDGLGLVGNPMTVSARTLRDRGVDLPLPEIVDYLNQRVAAGVAASTPWQPGARELLDSLVAAGVPMALVTSSYRMLSEPFAAAAGCFDVIVSGDTVTRAKPDPEPYLTAAELLGVPIERCVAVEDSRAGITSALASGARTVGVEVFQPVEPRPGLVRVPDLGALTVEALCRIALGEAVRS